MYGGFECPECGSHEHTVVEEGPSANCLAHLKEQIRLLRVTRTATPLAYADAVLLMLRALRTGPSASAIVERLNKRGVFFVRVDKPG